MRIIEESYATLPDQPRPNPRRRWDPCQAPSLPYSVERDIQSQYPEWWTRNWYFWKPQGKSCRLGFYPTLCDHWKPSYVNPKFWVAHLLRSPGVGHPSSGKTKKSSATPQSDFFLCFKPNGTKKCHSGDLFRWDLHRPLLQRLSPEGLVPDSSRIGHLC